MVVFFLVVNVLSLFGSKSYLKGIEEGMMLASLLLLNDLMDES